MPFRVPLVLWFDVEERYNTTIVRNGYRIFVLWFDVEERYNTTIASISPAP